MKSSLKNGKGGGGGCHSHAATGAPVVSLSPPACLTAVKTPQHPFTHVQMPPTDVKLTFGWEGGGEEEVEVWGRQERKVISGAKQGGQVSRTQQRREESGKCLCVCDHRSLRGKVLISGPDFSSPRREPEWLTHPAAAHYFCAKGCRVNTGG